MLSPTFFSAGFILMILKSNSWPGSSLMGAPCESNGLRVVAQALDSVGDLDKRPEARQSKHLAMDHIAHAMLIEEGVPHVWLKLFHAQRKAALLRLDRQNDCPYLVAL